MQVFELVTLFLICAEKGSAMANCGSIELKHTFFYWLMAILGYVGCDVQSGRLVFDIGL